MRGFGWVLSAIAASGCGFQVSSSTPGSDPDAGSGSDSAPDAPDTDAAPIERKLYAASDTMLYELDVDLKTAALVGQIATGSTPFDVGGLAFDGTNIIGLSDDGSELLIIDPSTAAVTARRAISPAGTYYGLTVAPAGEAGPTAVVFAGATGSKLVAIDQASGAATTVGTYGGGMIFYTDLAWVNGVGLFITLQSGSCSPRCFAKLDHTTGVAAPIRYNLTANVYGLSGYRGMLWALHHEGAVTLVNQTNGLMTNLGFDPNIPWTEAAQ
ncbi:MAG: hypothetical protein ACKV2T_16640 [Kofleriaceae bacterium]